MYVATGVVAILPNALYITIHVPHTQMIILLLVPLQNLPIIMQLLFKRLKLIIVKDLQSYSKL